MSERLKERREAAGLTLGQVSTYEGVTAQYLSQLETEKRSPNVWPLLARLALRYKTSADYLLGLTDNPAPAGVLNTVARQAKVSNVHPHRFRHTFAITFLRNGGNTFALQKLLGHSELSTVLKYVRLAETDIRQAQAAASVVDNWRL